MGSINLTKPSKIGKNILISIFAQASYTIVCLFINLLVPKFVGELTYAHYQTYALYVSYVGIFHFGILDGILLRYAAFDYDELDKKKIRSQFYFLLIILSIVGLLLISIGLFQSDEIAHTILILLGFCVITKNFFTYTSYTFQITNRINLYASHLIVARCIFIAFMVILFVFKCDNFFYFCLADFLSEFISTLIFSLKNKKLVVGSFESPKEVFQETKNNLTAGFKILISAWSALLITGLAKIIIQLCWDDLTFGKVTLAFSVTNMFLSFITAISTVLFPSIKRIQTDQLPVVYVKIQKILNPILGTMLIFYFPGYLLFSVWLPSYSDSLVYIGLLLPVILYSSKVSLVSNTFLKAFRKENILFYVNIFSMLLAGVLYVISALILKSIYCVVISNLLVIIFESLILDLFVNKIIKKFNILNFLFDLVLSCVFIVCAIFLNFWTGLIVFSIVLIIYLALQFMSNSHFRFNK